MQCINKWKNLYAFNVIIKEVTYNTECKSKCLNEKRYKICSFIYTTQQIVFFLSINYFFRKYNNKFIISPGAHLTNSLNLFQIITSFNDDDETIIIKNTIFLFL